VYSNELQRKHNRKKSARKFTADFIRHYITTELLTTFCVQTASLV